VTSAENRAVSSADAVSDQFREVFGRAPEVAWHAPGRVNLIGEHTDYNDGFVLPFALPSGVVAAAARAPGYDLRVASTGYPGELLEVSEDARPGSVSGWAAYPAGVLWRLRRDGLLIGGVDLLLDSTLPSGAGLSSSAAVECAVGMAVDQLLGLGLDRVRMAGVARSAENDFVGMPCGLMDQYASLLCVEGHALFLDTRTRVTEQVPLDFDAAGLALLLVDTASPHRLVSGDYAARRKDCEQAAAELGVAALRDVEPGGLVAALDRLSSDRLRARVRHVVSENARVREVVGLLRTGRPERIGELLTASHESLRDDHQVAGPEQDLAVRAALDAGALGARMTGGGFGGSAIALVEAAAAGAAGEAVAVAFAEAGFPAPRCAPVSPSAGARRLGR
jgi:galactokinase